MNPTQNAQIGRKNSTTVYTRPTTAAQTTYFSRHGGKKNLYHTSRQIVRLVWLIIATVGLRAVLLSIAPGLPNFETISWVVALLVVGALHNLLEEVTKTFWFDRFDDKDGDGDTRDAADSSPILPIIICVGLIAADFLGARTYLYSSIAPANTADRAALSQEKTQALAQERADYEKRAAEIEQRFDAKKRAATAAAAAEVRQWNAKTIYSDNDRAWVSRGIAAVNARRDAALARLDGARGEELSAARTDFDAAKKRIETHADRAEARADDHDTREMSRVLDEQAAAHNFSWLISLFLAVLYMAFMYAEVRISARSGIFPVRNYTALDAHGGVLEKFWKWVVVDVWQRFSHNFMVQAHERLAVRNLADFDGHLIEIDHAAREVRGLPDPIASAPKVDSPLPREVLRLRLEIGDLWNAVCEYGEANDEIAVWEKRRELLEDYGWVSAPKADGSVSFYAQRMSFSEMDRLHPLPRIRAFAPHPTRPTAAVASPAAAHVLEMVENRRETLSDSVGQNNRQQSAVLVADIEKWSQRARQCHRRTHPRSQEARSEEARATNAKRRDAFLECLQLVGCTVGSVMTGETVADNDIDIRRPSNEVAASLAGQNQPRLLQLLRFLGEVKEEI